MRLNEGGHFAPGGYVVKTGNDFTEQYHGIEDIPAEHRVFTFPALSIREQLTAYQEVAAKAADHNEKSRPDVGREER